MGCANSRLAVDIGGTFTDVAAVGSDGILKIAKRLTRPGGEHKSVLESVDDAGIPLPDVDILAHGTTLVINALLERRGARTALVTTSGFRDVLQIGRGNRPEIFNPVYSRDPEIVPRELRFEVSERVYASGDIGLSPPLEELERLVNRLADERVEAVGISFINAYCEPANENLVAEFLRARLPDVFITTSSSLSRQWREYERTCTAAANAFVGPVAKSYVHYLRERFVDRGFRGMFIGLDSSGGALQAGSLERFPIRVIESGPVGGVLGSQHLASSLGVENLVTFDMGGTTAKTCLIENGEWSFSDVYWVNGYSRGYPIQVPSMEIIEVGAGGGSIAWIDEAGRLRVGPKSAGANPGPACYGLGGTEPTVSDANVYCGRISRESFLSSITLHPDRATKAITELASRVNMPPLRLALGILELANLSMASAVRRQTIEKGRDPRDFTLVAFGGAGPMHACDVAARAGIQQVLIPVTPGHFSAVGMLRANLRFDWREVLLCPLEQLDRDRLSEVLARASKELSDLEGLEAVSEIGIRNRYALAMRFQGQEHTLLIGSSTEDLAIPPDIAATFRRLFEEEYLLRYGHLDATSSAEVVEVVVVRERPLPSPKITGTIVGGRLPSLKTEVHFDEASGIETPMVPRLDLKIGEELAGPMVIYEEGAHTVVPPAVTVRVLNAGHLLMSLPTERST